MSGAENLATNALTLLDEGVGIELLKRRLALDEAFRQIEILQIIQPLCIDLAEAATLFTASERDDQALVRGIAIHEVDAFPGNLDASVAAHETVERATAKEALALPAIFDELEF